MLREQTTSSALGVLSGLAIGDALGRPANGLSHQNVRLYFKGIKEYRDDEHRRGTAGTGSALTSHALATAHALACGDTPPQGDDHLDLAAATVWGVVGVPHHAPPTLPRVHAWAVGHLATQALATFDLYAFWHTLIENAPDALARKLVTVTPDPDDVPLDLADACGGTDTAENAWMFAVAMFARNPRLVEATLLSAINVGGQTATVGALVGSLLGALHGAEAFPVSWRDELGSKSAVDDAAAALESLNPETLQARKTPR